MIQQTLFHNGFIAIPKTQGIKYAGSKLKLLPKILELTAQSGVKTVLDGFSGSTRVSQALAQSGYTVTSNDIAVWSEVIATCYLKNQKLPGEYKELIDHLNAVPATDGWFSKHYGGLPNGGSALQDDGLKRPWQIHNTRKLDAVREEIDRLHLDIVTKCVALTSLMLAMDEVDSTLGHYVSYLSDWSPRSYKMMHLRVPQLFRNEKQHTVLCNDIFETVKGSSFDLAYFDPPYGSNNEKMPPSRVRYSSYYHIWTSVCLNDKPEIFGKAKRRVDTSDTASSSVFEEFRQGSNGRFLAVAAIDKLIQTVNAKYILLSYSSGGRATAEEIYETLHKNGNLLETVEIDYKKNVMADMKWTHEWTADAAKPNKELLFLLEKE
ncbi:MAG: DNA adenine methylase [Planctomycetaceae bacterium]|jgi:adenine-specific DNA-methyltransferase|nr:DNA adenine methylase [Planctomycetaceae bacterium]